MCALFLSPPNFGLFVCKSTKPPNFIRIKQKWFSFRDLSFFAECFKADGQLNKSTFIELNVLIYSLWTEKWPKKNVNHFVNHAAKWSIELGKFRRFGSMVTRFCCNHRSWTAVSYSIYKWIFNIFAMYFDHIEQTFSGGAEGLLPFPIELLEQSTRATIIQSITN